MTSFYELTSNVRAPFQLNAFYLPFSCFGVSVGVMTVLGSEVVLSFDVVTGKIVILMVLEIVVAVEIDDAFDGTNVPEVVDVAVVLAVVVDGVDVDDLVVDAVVVVVVDVVVDEVVDLVVEAVVEVVEVVVDVVVGLAVVVVDVDVCTVLAGSAQVSQQPARLLASYKGQLLFKHPVNLSPNSQPVDTTLILHRNNKHNTFFVLILNS